MAGRTWKTLAVLGLAGVAAFWYGSPYVALYSIRAAAAGKDAASFNAHVDYPRVRASLKVQLSEALAGTTGKAGGAGAAIISMLGGAATDRFVDALVRPEVIMRAMEEARVGAAGDEGDRPEVPGEPQAPGSPGRSQAAGEGRLKWVTSRPGLDKLVVFAGRNPQNDLARVGFVLERSGFADWKLTEIRLPRMP